MSSESPSTGSPSPGSLSTGSAAAGSPGPGAGPHRVRASNAERERIAQILSTATADGLLTLEEADERLAAAYDARYRDELGPLTADLPVDPGPPRVAPPPRWRRLDPGMARAAAVIAVISGLLIVASWHAGDHWHSGVHFPLPALLLGFLIFRLVTRGRRRQGSWRSAASAESVLAQRYARGEIDEQEYQRSLGVLRHGG